MKLHKLSEHLLEVLKRCMLRVARCARIRSCGLAEERKILFLELLKLGRNTYIDGELTDCIDRCLPVL